MPYYAFMMIGWFLIISIVCILIRVSSQVIYRKISTPVWWQRSPIDPVGLLSVRHTKDS